MAIQSSRISTHLHFHCAPGEVPDDTKGCYYPCRTFCGTGGFCGLSLHRNYFPFHLLFASVIVSPAPPTGANHRSAQVLILLVIPGHVIFLYTIHLMKSGHTTLTPIFMSVYLATALLQVRRGNLNHSTDMSPHQTDQIVQICSVHKY